MIAYPFDLIYKYIYLLETVCFNAKFYFWLTLISPGDVCDFIDNDSNNNNNNDGILEICTDDLSTYLSTYSVLLIGYLRPIILLSILDDKKCLWSYFPILTSRYLGHFLCASITTTTSSLFFVFFFPFLLFWPLPLFFSWLITNFYSVFIIFSVNPFPALTHRQKNLLIKQAVPKWIYHSKTDVFRFISKHFFYIHIYILTSTFIYLICMYWACFLYSCTLENFQKNKYEKNQTKNL